MKVRGAGSHHHPDCHSSMNVRLGQGLGFYLSGLPIQQTSTDTNVN